MPKAMRRSQCKVSPMPSKTPAGESFEALLKNSPNPSKLAKRLEKIAKEDFGLFFAKLSEIPLPYLASVVMELPPWLFKEAVQRLPHKKVAQSLFYLESNEATDFMQRLEKVDPKIYELIYSMLQADQRQQIDHLSRYREDEVGAYMQVEMLRATTKERLEDVKKKIEQFRKQKPLIPLIKVFVTDEEGHLVATPHFSDLLLFSDDQTLEKIIEVLHPHKPLSINDHAPINDAVRLFEEMDLATLAVVDKEGKLVGRILFDDIYDLIREQEETMALRLSGVHHEMEEDFFSAQWARLRWIFINLGAILVASSVVYHFQDAIEKIVALAVLMPIVAALGGNVGNQAVTVTVRRLALGEIDVGKAKSILTREVAIGVLNGLIVGIVVGILAYFWFGKPLLGLVAWAAILINLSLAGLVGALLPILFKKMGVDPAIASPLLLTTTTDAMGFFVFLGLAKALLL